MNPEFLRYRGFDIEVGAVMTKTNVFWTGRYEIRRDSGPWTAAALTLLHSTDAEAITHAISYAKEYIDSVLG